MEYATATNETNAGEATADEVTAEVDSVATEVVDDLVLPDGSSLYTRVLITIIV